MSRIFLSVLGTGNYQPCEYVINGERLPETRYIQEASVRYFCRNWDFAGGDRIKILCSEESFKIHWDNGTKDSLSASLSWLNQGVSCSMIPRGQSKEEIWRIFDVFFESVNQGDEIWLDVTHGFRSMPMLALIAVPYLRLLKKAVVKSITYGAYESRNEDGSIPVFDLTDFLDLMDWTNAARNFVEYGRFDDCKKLMNEANRNILRETKGKDEEAALCRDVSNKVDDFCQKITQNRLNATIVKGLPEGVIENLQNLGSRSLRVAPFKPLVKKIEEKLNDFSEEGYGNVFTAVDWCIEHRFLQNGYSILLEGCISIALAKLVKDKVEPSECSNDEKKRKLPIDIATAWVKKTDGFENAQYIPLRDSVFAGNIEYAKVFELLNKTRNAFMHCGTGSNELPGSMGDLEKRLCESNETLKQWYKELGV